MKKELGNKILFARKNKSVIIPTKIEENGGFDIYANFEEDYVIIEPHETKMIPTGLHSAFSPDYVAVLKERGSTGTKGMGQRSGIIDSGYRSAWFVPLTNHNDIPVMIYKNENDLVIMQHEYDDYIAYPYSKSIAQIIMVEVPKLYTEEVTMDELLSYKSERGFGALGSSNK